MFAHYPMSWYGGCALGPSLARRTIFLEVGRYTLQVRGNPYFNDRGGVYVVKLNCSGGATTRAATSSDPGGLSVDAITGSVSGTPQQVGENFQMQLRAVDSVRGPTVVAEWRFNVQDPIFGTSSAWIREVYEYNASRGIVPR